jgi:hypothetical protein
MLPPNGDAQPPPGESHGGDGDAVGHSTTRKIAATGRSAAAGVGPLVLEVYEALRL